MATKDIVAAVMGEEEDCFPPTATVVVQGKGRVEMKDLTVGDRVLTSSAQYQTVYLMDHYHPYKPTWYVQIYTGLKDEKPLELSPHHMVFVHNHSTPRPAVEIQIGDRMLSLHGLVSVSKIEYVVREGLYNFLTEDGTMVVDGIVTSTYAALGGKTYIEVGGWQLISYQSLYHILLKPYRQLCMLQLNLGQGQPSDREDEYDSFVLLGKQLIAWWKLQRTWAQAISLAGLLFVFSGLNLCCSTKCVAVVGAFLFVVRTLRSRRKSNKMCEKRPT
jgi:hypothetical protein